MDVLFYYPVVAHSLYSLQLQCSLICSNKMPEGPELRLASLYVNKMCNGMVFTGPVRKSEVSKNPDVPFTSEAFCITATSRGKEVKLTLTPMKSDDSKRRPKAGQADQPMDVVFRFGMSGYFRFTTEDDLPKHSHLRFYTKEKPCRVLSFVDARRFGSWQPGGTWQPSRGPCIMSEYKSFRLVMLRVSHVLPAQPSHHCRTDQLIILQGECHVTPVQPCLWQAYLWSSAQSEVLQWYWELPESWNPFQVINMHNPQKYSNDILYSYVVRMHW